MEGTKKRGTERLGKKITSRSGKRHLECAEKKWGGTRKNLKRKQTVRGVGAGGWWVGGVDQVLDGGGTKKEEPKMGKTKGTSGKIRGG